MRRPSIKCVIERYNKMRVWMGCDGDCYDEGNLMMGDWTSLFSMKFLTHSRLGFYPISLTLPLCMCLLLFQCGWLVENIIYGQCRSEKGHWVLPWGPPKPPSLKIDLLISFGFVFFSLSLSLSQMEKQGDIVWSTIQEY